MNAVAASKPIARISASGADRYARAVQVSRRVRWDIDADVIRGRRFDLARKFLPDGLTRAHRIDFLGAPERRFLSQVQGRTYANMFRLVERFIGAKMLDASAGSAPTVRSATGVSCPTTVAPALAKVIVASRIRASAVLPVRISPTSASRQPTTNPFANPTASSRSISRHIPSSDPRSASVRTMMVAVCVPVTPL